MTALRRHLTRTRKQSLPSLAQVAAVYRREGFAVCRCLLCLEGEGEGVHVERKMAQEDCHFHEVDYGLVPGKRSLGRRFAKDYDEDAITRCANPRHFDKCEPGELISTHHRRRHQ
jgi:hypothetical protein